MSDEENDRPKEILEKARITSGEMQFKGHKYAAPIVHCATHELIEYTFDGTCTVYPHQQAKPSRVRRWLRYCGMAIFGAYCRLFPGK